MSHLLYADDLVHLEANGDDLQKSLDVVGSWCDANSLIINNNKSGVLHVRPKKVPRTTKVFTINGLPVEIRDSYTSLGIPIT